MLGSIPGSPFWNFVKYPLRFLLNLLNGIESSTLYPKLQLGEEVKVTGGPDRVSMGDGGSPSCSSSPKTVKH